MNIPTYDEFIEPLLRTLAKHPQGLIAAQARELTAESVGLSETQRLELLPSGQPVYANRIGWAHDRLKRAGFSHSPRRGRWQVTDEGQAFLTTQPDPFPAGLGKELALAHIDSRLRPGGEADDPDPAELAAADAKRLSSPDERIAEAMNEIRQSVVEELRELLGQVDPQRFESIVLDVLHAIGYGAKRSDLLRMGASGDGGIDGIISLDRLGLEKVYVQAKRWQSNVGAPEVQGFYGALAGRRATKGVFITTSGYTRQALDFAASVDKIVLVDGARLAELMIDHDVGVSNRSLRLPRVDGDYFE